MKKLTILFVLYAFVSIGQTKKELRVLSGLNELNQFKVNLVLDNELNVEAKRFADAYNKDMTAEDVALFFNYNTPSQKYLSYITFMDYKYDGKEIANFFWAQDVAFYEYAQYKSKVGIYADDKICIILFFKNKNVITVSN